MVFGAEDGYVGVVSGAVLLEKMIEVEVCGFQGAEEGVAEDAAETGEGVGLHCGVGGGGGRSAMEVEVKDRRGGRGEVG